MHKIFLAVLSLVCFVTFSQTRPINRLTLKNTYMEKEIPYELRKRADEVDKQSYFNDDYFNGTLKKAMLDQKLTEKDKVQFFYLLNKKIGYAFAGLEYLPPGMSYFYYRQGQNAVRMKTLEAMKDLKYHVNFLVQLVDSNLNKDVLLAGNALLLATILDPAALGPRLAAYSKPEKLMKTGNPALLHHYICSSISLTHDKAAVANLLSGVYTYSSQSMIEDAWCAIYSTTHPVSAIRDYVIKETDPKHDIAIQTALGALTSRVPPASFKQAVKQLSVDAKEDWKKTLCDDLYNDRIPFNYRLTSKDQVVTKSWEGVEHTLYTDGVFILFGKLVEFDPN